MPLKDNYINYSSILKKDPPIYDFCLYTPSFTEPVVDEDGWLQNNFYSRTNQYYNDVPVEISDFDIHYLRNFMNLSVKDDGLIVEIGVWRNPNTKSMTSTQFFLETKKDTTQYLGIDIEDRPHVRNYKPNCEILISDSGNTPFISNYIKEK